MFLAYQNTLKHQISCYGIGIHTGANIKMTFKPAEADHGIEFRRTDIGTESGIIKAKYDIVTNTMLGTSLTNKHGVKIATVEHLLAAFWGTGIDNVIVEIDGPEIPIMDGSSDHFVFMIECAGREQQNKMRKILEVIKPIYYDEKESSLILKPSDSLKINVDIDFKSKAISNQAYAIDIKDFSFKNEISKARTFGFLSDFEKLKAMGLARGASLKNAVGIGPNDEILNEEGLRFEDEFVRHKALDLTGDFYLSGFYMKADINAVRPGHGVNNNCLRNLFANKDSYRIIDLNLASENCSIYSKDISSLAA